MAKRSAQVKGGGRRPGDTEQNALLPRLRFGQRRIVPLMMACALACAGVAPAQAREGVEVGGNSAFTNLVSADTVERSATQQYAQMLHTRLEVVREIKEGMGIHAPKVEELATRKMRAERPELASDWDAMREAQRRHQALLRKQEQERKQAQEQRLGRSQSLGLSRTV